MPQRSRGARTGRPLLLATCLLAGCTHPAPAGPAGALLPGPLSAADMDLLPPPSSTFSGSFPFLDRQIALPPGEWLVLATKSYGLPDVGPVAGVAALGRFDGNRLHSLFWVVGNARPAAAGVPLSPICQTSDVIWNDVRQSEPNGNQDCAVITFIRPVLWRSDPHSIGAAVSQRLDELNVQVPNVLVPIEVHEANANWFLGASLFTNPDMAGIPPDPATDRARSLWLAFRIANDPARRAYIDQLKHQAAEMQAALRRQIDAPAPFMPHTDLTPA